MTVDPADLPLVETTEHAGQVVVRVRGELDVTNVGAVEQSVAAYLERRDVSDLVFDMAELTFMDSSALAVLLQAAAAGKTVWLRHPSELVAEIVTATGLEGVLRIEP